MKKILSILLIAVMTVCCFNGCGKSATTKGDKNKILIKYWLSGYGDDWINNMIEGFEKKYPEYDVEIEMTASASAVNSSFGHEDADEADLYFCSKDISFYEYLEPLNDILETKVEGESMTIGEKMMPSYLALEKYKDGNYYNLTYGSGAVGIYYNKAMFNEYGLSVPRTTDELVNVCATLWDYKEKAFCHFKPVGYWENYMPDVFMVQYDGLDYVLNNFYGCTDEQGNSPSLDVLTKQDGRFEALKVFESIITPEYVMVGSNSYDHITAQTMWLEGEAAMMVNGTWIVNEMQSVMTMEDFALMRTPVITSILDHLTTITTDKQLRQVVSAIDSVTDGEKEESDYLKDGQYMVGDLAVSADDWTRVRLARNTMALNAPGDSAYIPNYSDNIEGAKAFLTYMYSDEGYKIYTDTLHSTLPMRPSEGEVDMSGWTEVSKQQAHIVDTTEQFISEYNASAHDVFNLAGARWKGNGRDFLDRFCSNNTADRITAVDAWNDILAVMKDNYSTWIEDIK